MAKTAKKHYVLDTNILLRSPQAIFGFEDNHVIILGTTLQELDSKKREIGEVGYNARESIRQIEALREKGDLIKGVALPHGGLLSVVPNGVDEGNLPKGYSIKVADNRIISACITLNSGKYAKNHVILVTEDVSLRVNGTICGLKVEGYRNTQVVDSKYTGHTVMEVPYTMIDDLYEGGVASAEGLDVSGLLENEFVTLKSMGQSALSVYRGGNLNLVKEDNVFGVTPLNAMQRYALWALTQPADKIPLVILIGPAGTAKTYLSLAAGLNGLKQAGTSGKVKSAKGQYSKLMISRPAPNSFQNIGFLPGTLEEKLGPLYASYYDNMSQLLSGKPTNAETMIANGTMEICALDFIRGRSLMNTYLICDEAQNASQGLIRDVVTRAGAGTKVVLAGDPEQIDAPTLDKRNNGLVFAAEAMHGSPLCAIINFEAEDTVRSELSKEAVKRMLL